MPPRLAKGTHRLAVGIECDGRERMFPTSFSYDQHRRSPFMRGTASCAFPDENRTTVTATQRLNMSTAAVERRKGQRMQGTILQNMHIVLILHIMHIKTNAKIEILVRALLLR